MIFRIEAGEGLAFLLTKVLLLLWIDPRERTISRAAVFLHPMKEGHEAVVILLSDGILFVIVASSASHGHPEKGLGGDLHIVGEKIVLSLEAV